MVVVVNIVTTGRLANLDFARALRDFGPRTPKFRGLVVRLSRSTCLLFPNGAIVVVGIKSVRHIGRIPRDLQRCFPGSKLITDGGYYVIPHVYLRVCNMVATTSFGRSISLPKLYNTLKNNLWMTYEPEVFPGLRIDLNCGVVAIVFYSGKAVLTAGLEQEDLELGEGELLNYIKSSDTTICENNGADSGCQ